MLEAPPKRYLQRLRPLVDIPRCPTDYHNDAKRDLELVAATNNEASPPLSTPTENETPTATVTYRLWNFAILEPTSLTTLQAWKRKRFAGRRGFGKVQKYEIGTTEPK